MLEKKAVLNLKAAGVHFLSEYRYNKLHISVYYIYSHYRCEIGTSPWVSPLVTVRKKDDRKR